MFDRFLARVVLELGNAVTLKGGLVLELRLERARTTTDVVLRLVGSAHDVLTQLQHAARRDLGDFMTFEVGPDEDHPDIRNDGMQYEGKRYRAECKLAGKLYGQPFGVDVAFGDPILGEPDTLVAEEVLSFAGYLPTYAASLSCGDTPCRETSRVHDGAPASELSREGPTRHRFARHGPAPRCKAAA